MEFLIFLVFGFLIFLVTVYLVIFGQSSAKILGDQGERIVIRKLNKLDKRKYMIFNDVVFENNGKKSQIDHIVVSDYGIFVIETKNYKGAIYGAGNKTYWTQYLGKKNFKFYNPVKQNQGHIYALEHILKGLMPLEFISIVVFTERAKLKVAVNTPLVFSNKLLKTIYSYDSKSLNDDMKFAISETIRKHNLNEPENK